MSYIYGNIEDAKVEDVIEAVITDNGETTKGKLYVIRQGSTNGSIGHFTNDEGDASSGINLDSGFWKLVKTSPANTAKVGNKVICIAEDFALQVSNVKTVTEVDKENSVYSIKLDSYWHRNIDFLVLCTEESSIKRIEFIGCKIKVTPETRQAIADKLIEYKLTNTDGRIDGNLYLDSAVKGYFINENHTGFTLDFDYYLSDKLQEIYWIDGDFSFEKPIDIASNQKRNLAFYKASGEPWTEEEYINICTYVGDETTTTPKLKYIFDDGKPTDFMYDWSPQEQHSNFDNCTKVNYESIFKVTESKQTKTQTKGNNMNSCNENITVTMTAAEYAKHNKTSKCKVPKTDLQLEIKYPYTAKIFTIIGVYKSKLNAKSLVKLNKLIAKHLSHNQFDIVKTLKVIETTTTKELPLVKTKIK